MAADVSPSYNRFLFFFLSFDTKNVKKYKYGGNGGHYEEAYEPLNGDYKLRNRTYLYTCYLTINVISSLWGFCVGIIIALWLEE